MQRFEMGEKRDIEVISESTCRQRLNAQSRYPSTTAFTGHKRVKIWEGQS
jgi:hypothetical protein